MEYFSKLTINRKEKKFILNEEALQSLDADTASTKVIILAPIKEEGADEKTLYLLNVVGSNIGSDKAEDAYLEEIFPKDKVRIVITKKDDEGNSYGEIPISDDVIDSFDKLFGKDTNETKLVYQESVVGDMKSLKDVYNIKGIYHKISKISFKKNVIGKTSDIENMEEVISLKDNVKKSEVKL